MGYSGVVSFSPSRARVTDIGRRKWSGNLPGLFINGRVGGSGFRVSAGRVLTDGGPKQGSDERVVNIDKGKGFL